MHDTPSSPARSHGSHCSHYSTQGTQRGLFRAASRNSFASSCESLSISLYPPPSPSPSPSPLSSPITSFCFSPLINKHNNTNNYNNNNTINSNNNDINNNNNNNSTSSSSAALPPPPSPRHLSLSSSFSLSERLSHAQRERHAHTPIERERQRGLHRTASFQMSRPLDPNQPLPRTLSAQTLQTLPVRYEMDEEELREVSRAQRQALDILSQCDPKPVIALDLDYTLWPAYCYEHTLPPYRRSLDIFREREEREERDVLDVQDQIYCVCRRTGGLRTLSLYSQVKSVLEFCVDHSVVLTICSRSPHKTIVQEILSCFSLWDWFLFPQIFDRRKSYHFRQLMDATGLSLRDFLFFDDEKRNVSLITEMGVLSVQVQREKGLDWNTFLRGITMFHAKQRASRSLRHWLALGSISNSCTFTDDGMDVSCNDNVDDVDEDREEERERDSEREGDAANERKREREYSHERDETRVRMDAEVDRIEKKLSSTLFVNKA